MVEKTVTYFNEMSTDWSDKYQSRTFRERLETVLEWLPDNDGAQEILDYGCGSGVFSAELLKKGFQVTSVDASPGMVEATTHNLGQLSEISSSQYKVAVVDSHDFSGDYQEQQYDGICCMGVLEYVPEDEKLLDILCDLIKPGGFFIMSMPNQNSLLRGFERFVYHNPSMFKAMGLFSHLTSKDAYLNYQAHQYQFSVLKKQMNARGLTLTKHRFHVVPGVLTPFSGNGLMGMTMILKFEKKGM